MTDNNQIKDPFYVGICMAGAVSAGAYTAGVMDYLIEALQEWEKRRGEPGVPTHRVEIPIIGGASAGGMTSFLTVAAIHNKIVPIRYPTDDILAEHPENNLYHTWVDLVSKDMIPKLLDTSDIKKNVLSLLNSKFIDQLADRAIGLDMKNLVPIPSFFAKNLKIFTTLTNLKGFQYSVSFQSQKSNDPYYMKFHNDYACFQLTETDAEETPGGWMPLNFRQNTNVEVARQAAMATGAFPIGLKSRRLKRESKYVNDSEWIKQVADLKPIEDDFYPTLNIDGGLINNEPFEKVKQVLQDANYPSSTVLMIDPFPSAPDPEERGNYTKEIRKINLMRIVGLTLSTLLSQVRSKPHIIQKALNLSENRQHSKKVAELFLIAPTRQTRNGKKIRGERAIASGALAGFSGFLNKKFRVHDYFLGRHNCYIFLRDYFTVSEEVLAANPIFQEGYAYADKDKFKPAKEKKLSGYQIIPIFEEDYKFPLPKFPDGSYFPTMYWGELKAYKRLIKRRVQAVLLNLFDLSPHRRILLWIGAKVILNGLITKSLLFSIRTEMEDWKLMRKPSDRKKDREYTI